MTQIDWSKARKVFDFHFKGKAGKDAGDFYFISPLNDRFVSETGSYILFRDIKDLPELFEFSMRPYDSTWTGAGRPLVGTVCERRFPEVEGSSWRPVTICFIGEQKIFYRDEAGDEWANLPDDVEFRPIRTPAQLDAEKREKAIEEMTESSLYGHYAFTKAQAKIACGVLYDAGYRKVEVKP